MMRAAGTHPLLGVAAMLAAMTAGASFAGTPRRVARGTVPSPYIGAGKAQTLYDQTLSETGLAINSQNYETEFDAYDDQAADDFIVPDGVRWKITEWIWWAPITKVPPIP